MIKKKSIISVDDSRKTEGGKCEINSNVIDRDVQMEVKLTTYAPTIVKEAHVDFDPEVVQIKAGKAEVSDSWTTFFPLRLNHSFILNDNEI